MDKIFFFLEQLMEGKTPDKSRFNVEAMRKKNSWNYIDGVMCKAILDLYEVTKNDSLVEFVDTYLGYYINNSGQILGYIKEDYNIDQINSGKVLFRLYELTRNEKYRLAIENIYDQVRNHPRVPEGNFWHKKIYPNQVWLDGIYMCLPFYMEYETKFNKYINYNDIFNQISNVEKIMKDSNTNLPHHAYDSSRKAFWCDKQTGLSKNYWSRSIGWYLMSLVDIISIMNEMIYEQKRAYMEILQANIDAVIRFLDEETGMLYQVTNMGGREGNYLETSGTAMFAYTVMKAVRLELIPNRYLKYGVKAFEGIVNKYFQEENGTYSLGGICLVAGLGPENNPTRDGSFEYYISEPVVQNDGKGVGPFFMAYAEYLRTK